jgi:hypothetical protein
MSGGTAIELGVATAAMLSILAVRAWFLRRVWNASGRNARLLAVEGVAEIVLFILLIWAAFLTRSPLTLGVLLGGLVAMVVARRVLSWRIVAEEVPSSVS